MLVTLRNLRLGQFGAIWLGTVLLFAFAELFAPSAVSRSSVLGMLPFAAILAMAASGEMLAIQQRGLDFSVVGVMSVTIVIMTKYPSGSDARLAGALGLAFGVAALVGLLNGVAIVFFRIPPLVATLGMSAILQGAAQSYSGGFITSATGNLNRFMLSTPAGIPMSVIIAGGLVVISTIIAQWSTAGRRFVAVGANFNASRAAGLRTGATEIGTYILGALFFCVAGVVYTGFLGTPDINAGTQYLLGGVAAVVMGGTALTGGRGSFIATAIACVFLRELSQTVFALGAPTSTQYLVEAGAIGVAMALRVRGRTGFGTGDK